tara:strand:+ start:814 stop:1041 length:228 start_codon:yes stop_codon:yes gene_type:complete
MATNDFLLDELRYLRERSDKQVESIIELRTNVADIEKTCVNIQAQITKMFFLVGGAAAVGGAGAPIFQALMKAAG